MSGKVENLLKNRRKKGPVVFVLIDSEASNINSSVKLAKDAEKLGAASILVGGSSATDQMEMAEVVGNLKKAVKIPIVSYFQETLQGWFHKQMLYYLAHS